MIVKTFATGYHFDIHYIITFWHWKFKNTVPAVYTFRIYIYFEAACFAILAIITQHHSFSFSLQCCSNGPEKNLNDRKLSEEKNISNLGVTLILKEPSM